MQVSNPYAITGPDGTRAVFGNGPAALADPDWVAYLDPDNGVSIARTIREDAEDLVDADGGVQGINYLGRSTISLQGALPAGDPIVTNALEQKIKRATRALRGDAQLRFQPDGFAERSYWVRRAIDPTFTGRRVKAWALQLVSEAPYALSPTESSAVIVPGAAAGELGFSSPIVNPLASPANVTGQVFVINAGDAPTFPRFRIDGPITNPRILNNSTGLELRFTITLAASEWLDVWPPRPYSRILFNGVTDRYATLNRGASRWWTLEPGSTDVRLLASAYSAGASLTVYWRNAWE